MKAGKLQKNSNNKLIKHGTKDFGTAIYSEALAREKKAREDKVIAEVQRLEQARLEYTKKADFALKALEWYRAKLEAIRKGEFDFDIVHGQMIFHDPNFERANF